MAANLVTVELLHMRVQRSDRQTHLDYRDDRMLRETLENLVVEHRGDANTDLSQWSMRVRSARGTVIATVTVDESGRTDVTR